LLALPLHLPVEFPVHLSNKSYAPQECMAEDLQYPSVSCDFTENAPHISSLSGGVFTTQKIYLYHSHLFQETYLNRA
jgi:hypothetical protein